MGAEISPELQYILVVVGLFIVPRALQRFRIPSAISCVALGAAASMGFHLFHNDPTIRVFSTLGIVTLFLFAGLEVNVAELRRGQTIILQHLGIQGGLLAAGTLGASVAFGLETRAALLFALALLTPSTGFILDSLGSLGLDENERFWVKSKAIASELVALLVLFLTVQSEDARALGTSALVLVAMAAFLPRVFRMFAARIAPHAPNTEFTFLVIVALLCAFVTRSLGVYYLVGAFVVGVTAVRMERDLPVMTSEKLLHAVEFFATFFIPFYFFKAGLHFEQKQFTMGALLTGLTLLVIVIPLKTLVVAVHRRIALAEPLSTGIRVGTSIIPTLVFTIVIAEILRERYALSDELFGALMVYTLLNTMIPGFALKVPPPEFDTPEVPRAPRPIPSEP